MNLKLYNLFSILIFPALFISQLTFPKTTLNSFGVRENIKFQSNLKPLQKEVDSAKIEYIVAYTKLLGYVRYFYPTEVTRLLNWDEFSLYGLNEVAEASSKKELVLKLQKIFASIAPSMIIFNNSLDENQAPPYFSPAYFQFVNQVGTKKRLLHHSYGYFDGEKYFYYIKSDTKRFIMAEMYNNGNPQMQGEFLPLIEGVFVFFPYYAIQNANLSIPKIDKKQNPGSLNMNFNDLMFSWNIFNNFYPLFEIVTKDWDLALYEAISETLLLTNNCDFPKILQKMVGYLNDAHAVVRPDNTECVDSYAFYLYPAINLVFVEGKLVVDATITTKAGSSLSGPNGIEVGDIVLSIDGISTEEYFEKELPFHSSLNEFYSKRFVINEILRGDRRKNITLEIKSGDGSIRKLHITRDRPEWYQVGKFTVVDLGNNLLYVNFLGMTLAEFEELVPQMKAADGIVFDLRGHINLIMPYFLEYLIETVAYGPKYYVPIYDFPEQSILDYDLDQSTWYTNNNYINNNLVFLMDDRAISYTEFVLSLIKDNNLGILVGTESAGANCNVESEYTPNGTLITWSPCKSYNLLGNPIFGQGIQPDIVVEPTIQGIIEGKDEILEKGIEILLTK